ncbi:hypothetical protein HYH03_005802 [Edaphochlamys debaryana]|uniref:Uncharacterized protein n=1 Tax=Edaphochlamys debaryana TaxID=47281 RepID=A0A835Y575_9CHLO|nr:hypothetical protein HYH03_005802 [Edaphochlamys debaryana]|eukprot:KAG2496203.1 hypothetical protein HYH03_005802 [Edaphochlamys debaryana]
MVTIILKGQQTGALWLLRSFADASAVDALPTRVLFISATALSEDTASLVAAAFPQLQTICLSNYDTAPLDEATLASGLERLLRLQPSLAKLDISLGWRQDALAPALAAALATGTRLRELSLSAKLTSMEQVKTLAGITNLRSLHVCGHAQVLQPLLSPLTALTALFFTGALTAYGEAALCDAARFLGGRMDDTSRVSVGLAHADLLHEGQLGGWAQGEAGAGGSPQSHKLWLEALGAAGVPQLQLTSFVLSHGDMVALASHTRLKDLDLGNGVVFPPSALLLFGRAPRLRTLHLDIDAWRSPEGSDPLGGAPGAREALLGLNVSNPHLNVVLECSGWYREEVMTEQLALLDALRAALTQLPGASCTCLPKWRWSGTNYTGCAQPRIGEAPWCVVYPNCTADGTASYSEPSGQPWAYCTGVRCTCLSSWRWSGANYSGCSQPRGPGESPWCVVYPNCTWVDGISSFSEPYGQPWAACTIPETPALAKTTALSPAAPTAANTPIPSVSPPEPAQTPNPAATPTEAPGPSATTAHAAAPTPTAPQAPVPTAIAPKTTVPTPQATAISQAQAAEAAQASVATASTAAAPHPSASPHAQPQGQRSAQANVDIIHTYSPASNWLLIANKLDNLSANCTASVICAGFSWSAAFSLGKTLRLAEPTEPFNGTCLYAKVVRSPPPRPPKPPSPPSPPPQPPRAPASTTLNPDILARRLAETQALAPTFNKLMAPGAGGLLAFQNLLKNGSVSGVDRSSVYMNDDKTTVSWQTIDGCRFFAHEPFNDGSLSGGGGGGSGGGSEGGVPGYEVTAVRTALDAAYLENFKGWGNYDYVPENYALFLEYVKGNIELDNYGSIWITPDFFQEHTGDMGQTIVFLSACHSAANPSLANVFSSKGSPAFLGYTREVYAQEYVKFNLKVTQMLVDETMVKDLPNYGAFTHFDFYGNKYLSIRCKRVKHFDIKLRYWMYEVSVTAGDYWTSTYFKGGAVGSGCLGATCARTNLSCGAAYMNFRQDPSFDVVHIDMQGAREAGLWDDWAVVVLSGGWTGPKTMGRVEVQIPPKPGYFAGIWPAGLFPYTAGLSKMLSCDDYAVTDLELYAVGNPGYEVWDVVLLWPTYVTLGVAGANEEQQINTLRLLRLFADVSGIEPLPTKSLSLNAAAFSEDTADMVAAAFPRLEELSLNSSSMDEAKVDANALAPGLRKLLCSEVCPPSLSTLHVSVGTCTLLTPALIAAMANGAPRPGGAGGAARIACELRWHLTLALEGGRHFDAGTGALTPLGEAALCDAAGLLAGRMESESRVDVQSARDWGVRDPLLGAADGGEGAAVSGRRSHTAWLEALGAAGVPRLGLHGVRLGHLDIAALASHTRLKTLDLNAPTEFPGSALLMFACAPRLKALYLDIDAWRSPDGSDPLGGAPGAREVLLGLNVGNPHLNVELARSDTYDDDGVREQLRALRSDLGEALRLLPGGGPNRLRIYDL